MITKNNKVNKVESLPSIMERGVGVILLNSIWESLGNLDMSRFKDRLLLQKRVFLLQELGMDLGYEFRKYIHGPYSSSLAKDGFALEIKNNSNNENAESFFEKLAELEKGHEGESKWLELLATIAYLRNKMEKKKSEIRLIIDEEKPYLSEDELIEEAYSRLINIGVIKD